MNNKLLIAFEKLEGIKAELLRPLSTLEPARFNRQPDGKWSMSQILTHLVSSEMLSLRYIRKKSLGADRLSDSGWKESAKMVVLRVSQRLPFLKFTAPAAVLEHTPSPLSFPDVTVQWNAARFDLRSLLESIPEKNVRKKVFKHPVVGMLDVRQAMEFFGEHIYHHTPQIRRLMK